MNEYFRSESKKYKNIKLDKKLFQDEQKPIIIHFRKIMSRLQNFEKKNYCYLNFAIVMDVRFAGHLEIKIHIYQSKLLICPTKFMSATENKAILHMYMIIKRLKT